MRTALFGKSMLAIRLLEVGRPKVTEAICRRLLGPLPEARSVGTHALHAAGSLAGAADLVVVEVHRWLAPRLRDAGWLLVPTDVRWQGGTGEVPPATPCRSLRSDLAKVRKRGFTVPVAEWIAARGRDAGPLVARQPGVAELCRPEAVEGLFRAEGKRAGFACWTLLFYALWHRRHVLGQAPAGDALETLAQA